MFWHVILPVAMMALVVGFVIVKDWIIDKDKWDEDGNYIGDSQEEKEPEEKAAGMAADTDGGDKA